MTITAAQLAQLLQGNIEGDPNATAHRPARIEVAQAGDFAFFDNPRYEQFAYTTEASILLVHEHFVAAHPIRPTLVRVSDVRSSLAMLLEMFGQHSNGASAGVISEKADISAKAQIGKGTSIGAFAVIEEGAQIGEACIIHPQVFVGKNAHIGDGTVLHPGVRVLYDCVIGQRCILHANAVIGADGFGFAPQEDKTWKKVPQVGNVIIHNDVEIGANTCIDRASLGSTIVHSGVKLDNLVHIAHNVEVGTNTVMAAMVAIAGSSKVGANCRFGGQSGMGGHMIMADDTSVQAQSAIAHSVKKTGTSLFGTPAFDYNEYVRSHIVFKQLPELQRKVRAIEKKVMLTNEP